MPTARHGAPIELPDDVMLTGGYDVENTVNLYQFYLKLDRSSRQDLMRVLAEMAPDTLDSLVGILEGNGPGEEARQKQYADEANLVALSETTSTDAALRTVFEDFANDLGVDVNTMGTFFLSENGRSSSGTDAPWQSVRDTDPSDVPFNRVSHGNPNDPTGHDDIVLLQDIHELVHGETEREEARVNQDADYQSALRQMYPEWEGNWR